MIDLIAPRLASLGEKLGDAMSRKGVAAIVALILIGAVVGCSTTPDQQAAQQQEQARLEAEIAARQGDQVSRVCPRLNDGWQAFGDNALLMQAGDQWYRLELAGTCDPEGAFAGIATRGSLGSSCLRTGDNVLTARPRHHERCVITAIYEWDEAPQPVEEPTEE